MRTLKLFTCLSLMIALAACSLSDDVAPELFADDTIAVTANLIDEEENLVPFTIALSDPDRPVVAADRFRTGWRRAAGTSIVAYLTINSESIDYDDFECRTALAGTDQFYPQSTELPDVFLEFITEENGNENCFLGEDDVTALVQAQTYQFGTSPGEVSLSLNARLNGQEHLRYVTQDEGALTITGIDAFTPMVLNEFGLYFNFRVSDTRLYNEVTDTNITIERLEGRLFIGF